MRELKFRAWFAKAEKMRQVDMLEFHAMNSVMASTKIHDNGGYWSEAQEYTHVKTLNKSTGKQVPAVVIMQYTGLKDSTTWEQLTESERTKWTRDGNMPSEWSGREIFEGDIVMITESYDGKNKVYKSKVEFHESCFLVWEPDGTDLPLFCFYTPDIPDGLTLRILVIGNLHENPELLGDIK